MNERDLVDWIAFGATVLSSMGILVAIIIYYLQERKSKKKVKSIKKNLVDDLDVIGDEIAILGELLSSLDSNYSITCKCKNRKIFIRDHKNNHSNFGEINISDLKFYYEKLAEDDFSVSRIINHIIYALNEYNSIINEMINQIGDNQGKFDIDQIFKDGVKIKFTIDYIESQIKKIALH
ncbi:hypothetical protein GKR50_10015 [Providencia rustigianii]|uniref:hypothetical protein n=1 Tax=Providencia rustigianii TaxID=158850 RepID=UPI000F6E115B|nr:hypothetical protein [Providencia rustigianii]MTC60351.1 hypothetical protein [Providencia rustigianii]VEH55008.1 Uncharacterised protein [Providencia rustigianii]